jgi:hypothetical protein
MVAKEDIWTNRDGVTGDGENYIMITSLSSNLYEIFIGKTNKRIT